MNKMSFIKGVGLGVVIGSAVGMAVVPHRSRAKAVGKAIKTVGGVVENVAGAMGIG